MMDYKGVGDIISEATGIRAAKDALEAEIGKLQSKVASNLKEIERLETLIEATDTLASLVAGKKKELADMDGELSKRLEKLSKLNIPDIFSKPAGGGVVNL